MEEAIYDAIITIRNSHRRPDGDSIYDILKEKQIAEGISKETLEMKIESLVKEDVLRNKPYGNKNSY